MPAMVVPAIVPATTVRAIVPAMVVPAIVPATVPPIVPIVMPIVIVGLLDRDWWSHNLQAVTLIGPADTVAVSASRAVPDTIEIVFISMTHLL